MNTRVNSKDWPNEFKRPYSFRIKIGVGTFCQGVFPGGLELVDFYEGSEVGSKSWEYHGHSDSISHKLLYVLGVPEKSMQQRISQFRDFFGFTRFEAALPL